MLPNWRLEMPVNQKGLWTFRFIRVGLSKPDCLTLKESFLMEVDHFMAPPFFRCHRRSLEKF